MVTCPKCGADKPAADFRKDGRVGQGCRSCRAEYRRARYLARRDEIRARQAKYRAENKDAIREQQRAAYWADPEKARAGRRKTHQRNRDSVNAARRGRKRTPEQRERERARRFERCYGITYAERDAMIVAQGGCAICGTQEPGAHDWCVDHDHSCCPGQQTCGKCVRGILCFKCNIALGCVNDDVDILRRAIDYLGASVSRMQPI